MQIKYNKQQISKLLGDLSIISGISISFLDIDYNLVCSYKNEGFCELYQSCGNIQKCMESDNALYERCKESGTYEWHICPAGLYDAAMPVVKEGITVGHIIMGRIRHAKSPKFSENRFEPRLAKLYEELPIFTDRQLESIKSLLPNILFSKAIVVETNTLFAEIENYITENISGDLSLGKLCKKFYLSKNAIYKLFDENCNMTVGEYIISKRIEKAKKLLSETEQSLSAICEAVGIDSCTYFCRLFKARCGCTPIAYRNKH